MVPLARAHPAFEPGYWTLANNLKTIKNITSKLILE
jgi:hypothetical protein